MEAGFPAYSAGQNSRELTLPHRAALNQPATKGVGYKYPFSLPLEQDDSGAYVLP